MAAEQEPRPITITVPANLPLPNPEGANFFHFTLVGDEIQFLVGSINLLRLHEAKLLAEPQKIVPDITHRFTLSVLGFHTLKAQVDQIALSVPEPSMPVTVKAE